MKITNDEIRSDGLDQKILDEMSFEVAEDVGYFRIEDEDDLESWATHFVLSNKINNKIPEDRYDDYMEELTKMIENIMSQIKEDMLEDE